MFETCLVQRMQSFALNFRRAVNPSIILAFHGQCLECLSSCNSRAYFSAESRKKWNKIGYNSSREQQRDSELSKHLSDPQPEKKDRQSHVKKYIKPKQQPLGLPFSLFVTCLPGLEPLLCNEIDYLQTIWNNSEKHTQDSSYTPEVIAGGVKITVQTLEHLYALRLYLGCASHIYLRLNEETSTADHDSSKCAQLPPLFSARGFPELERKLKDLMIAQNG